MKQTARVHHKNKPIFPTSQDQNGDIRSPKPAIELPSPQQRGAHSALSLLEEAKRSSDALTQLLFIVLEHDRSESFTKDNGYLAAGVQTLMWDCRENLDLAFTEVRTELNNAVGSQVIL